MEALVAIIIELLLPPIIAVGALILELIIAIVGGLIQLIGALFFGRSKKNATPPPSSAKPKKRFGFGRAHAVPATKTSKLAGTLKWIGAGTLAITMAAILIANFFFFEPLTRYAFEKVTERTGIALDASSIEGNLFTGTFAASGVTVSRSTPDKTAIQFDVGRVSGNLAITTLLSSTIEIESLSIADVTGAINTLAKKKDQTKGKTKPKRKFQINEFSISNADLNISKAGGEPINFKISDASSAPLRSNYALFDLLFRSNMQATIDGVPLTITMSGDSASGRSTTWNADGLRLASLNKLSTKAPISWLSAGTLDLNVVDQWTRDEGTSIDLDWRISLKDATLTAPEGAGLVSRTLIGPIANYVNRRDEPVDLEFSLLLDRENFQYANSLDSTGIWDAVSDEVAKQIAMKLGKKQDDVRSGIDNLKDTVKGVLGRNKNKEPKQNSE